MASNPPEPHPTVSRTGGELGENFPPTPGALTPPVAPVLDADHDWGAALADGWLVSIGVKRHDWGEKVLRRAVELHGRRATSAAYFEHRRMIGTADEHRERIESRAAELALGATPALGRFAAWLAVNAPEVLARIKSRELLDVLETVAACPVPPRRWHAHRRTLAAEGVTPALARALGYGELAQATHEPAAAALHATLDAYRGHYWATVATRVMRVLAPDSRAAEATRRRRTSDADELRATLHEVEPDDALDTLIAAETREALRERIARALDAAPPALRRYAVALADVDGDDVAAERQLGLTRGTGRVYRARLRRLLAAAR